VLFKGGEQVKAGTRRRTEFSSWNSQRSGASTAGRCTKLHRRSKVALQAGDDDVVCIHPRPGSACHCLGRVEACIHVSTPVFGGMLTASLLGIFVIPPLYVMFQAIREKLKSRVN
jgi:hypothetical protein